MIARILKSKVLSLGLFLVLGSLAGLLVKNLALGALGGLVVHLLIIGISEVQGSGSNAEPNKD